MINFIQLGANRGKSDTDIMWWLAREKRWNGIFVEPLPDTFELLKEHYTDLTGSFFEQVAVIGYQKYDQHVAKLSSPIRNPQIGIQRNGGNGECSYVCDKDNSTSMVTAMTLTHLIEKYNLKGVEFDLLQVDVEGADWDILMSTDFNVVLPKIIRVETIHMKEEQMEDLRKHLTNFGYNKIKDPYWDRFAELVPQHFKNNMGEPQKPEAIEFNTVYERQT